jgi:hypothetical protein
MRRLNQGGNITMRKYGLAALFVVAFAFPASAATKYFVVVDTVKNCSVIEAIRAPA